MSSARPAVTHTMIERCESCGEETVHNVSLEIREEGSGTNAVASRGPYRISRCRECGDETTQRMNNA